MIYVAAAIVGLFIGSLIGLIVSFFSQDLIWIIPPLLIFLCTGWMIFSDSMNVVQSVGRLYWVVRDHGKKGQPIISKGFMRMVDPPYKQGKGIQIRAGKYSFQVGLCHVVHFDSEEAAIYGVLDGRDLDDSPKEIGKWNDRSVRNQKAAQTGN